MCGDFDPREHLCLDHLDMALLLGKPKRRDKLSEQEPHLPVDSGEHNLDDLQALFRAHFEAQFAPLEGPTPPRQSLETTDADWSQNESESDWEGICDDEGISANIVEYQSTEARKGELPREEFKSFMVCDHSELSQYIMDVFSY